MRNWKVLALALSMLLFGILTVSFAADVEQKEESEKILRAPKVVTIDGNLKEWDASGKLGPITFDAESVDEFNSIVYAAYDATALYLAADVTIPHPPTNPHPIKGVGAWNADNVVIRMSSNPSLPVPLQLTPDKAAKSPDLFTIEFWWNHIKKQTMFDAYHGLSGKMLVGSKDMPGTNASIKTKADGKGYIFESKVPWSVINPKFKPKPGDEIAMTWEIVVGNGSQSEPKRMYQIFGNKGGAWAFTNAAMWGKAVFQ